MNDVGISIIILSYNEEKTIARAINSVINIVDELIIVDTGSTDETVSIASKLGSKIRIYHKAWEDNFSEIRNYAISLANYSICMMLDADEYLSDESKLNFREIIYYCLSKDRLALYSPLIKNLNAPNTMNNARIFYKRPSLQYKGRVHEYLFEENSYLIELPEIVIHHTGYVNEVYIEKNKYIRNKRLLNQQIQEDPNNIRWYYFMLNYLDKEEYEYQKILEIFGSLTLPYDRSTEIYALNIKLLLINRLLKNKSFNKAYNHATELFQYYKDRYTTQIYLLAKYLNSKNLFKLNIDESIMLLSSIDNRIEDKYINNIPIENLALLIDEIFSTKYFFEFNEKL